MAIAVASTLFAPLGARVAHSSPIAKLRGAFSGILFGLRAYMWWRAIW